MIISCDAYELDDDAARIDEDAAWQFLSTEAYWGRFRTRGDFGAQLATAWRVVGVYEKATGRMIGFARAVSDGVAFAYLADVYVLPEARGEGLGKELVRTMIDAARVLACAGPCTPPMRTACTASSASPRPMPCTWSGRPP